MLSTIVTLTDEQIKSLPNTPVEILPAPGGNKMFVPVFAVFTLDAIGGAYTNLDTDPLPYLLLAPDDFEAELTNYALGMPATTATKRTIVVTYSQKAMTSGALETSVIGTDEPSVNLFNQNICIWANNNAGNFEGGDPANTLTITVYYVIVDL